MEQENSDEILDTTTKKNLTAFQTCQKVLYSSIIEDNFLLFQKVIYELHQQPLTNVALLLTVPIDSQKATIVHQAIQTKNLFATTNLLGLLEKNNLLKIFYTEYPDIFSLAYNIYCLAEQDKDVAALIFNDLCVYLQRNTIPLTIESHIDYLREFTFRYLVYGNQFKANLYYIIENSAMPQKAFESPYCNKALSAARKKKDKPFLGYLENARFLDNSYKEFLQKEINQPKYLAE